MKRLSQAEERAVDHVVGIVAGSMMLAIILLSGVAYQVTQLVLDLPR